MKAKILLGVLLCVGMLACEKQEAAGTSAQNSSKEYQEVYDAMQQIIDKGAEYDITNVDALIVEGTGFWQLDALLGYTADYSAVTTIHRDFRGSGDINFEEPICAFGSDNRLLCYVINAEDGRIVEQQGSWSYEPRTMTISVEVAAYGANAAVAQECKLLSLSNDSLVFEWVSNEGEALRASLTPASLEEMKLEEVGNIVEELMEGHTEYSFCLVQSTLGGVWEVDSYLTYDDEWKRVTKVHKLMGVSYDEGGAYVRYTLRNDATGTEYVEFQEPGREPETKEFRVWYDGGILKFTGEELNVEYVLSACAFEYLVLDRESGDSNIRTILKRISE